MSIRKVKTKSVLAFVFSRSSRERERLREITISIKVVEKFQNLAAKCRTSSSSSSSDDDEANAPSAFLLVIISAVSFSSFSFLRNVGFGDTERIVGIVNISLNSDAIFASFFSAFVSYSRTHNSLSSVCVEKTNKNAISLKRRPEDDDDDDDISTPFVRRFFGEDRQEARTKKGEKKED